MVMLTQSERLALLLNLLGDETAAQVRSGLQGQRLAEIEVALNDFEKVPPSVEEIDFVLDDFQRYFTMAMETISADELEKEEARHEAPKILQIAEETFEVELEPTKKFEPPKLTGDTTFDLNQMHPYQVAHAIRKESPGVVALVVGKLANEHAAKTLELLPDALRSLVFLAMSQPAATKPMVMQCVLQTTLDLAMQVEERQEIDEPSDRMANLIRSLPKPVRAPILAQLATENAEIAEAVKKQLYLFTDLIDVGDRDLQKILGMCRTDVLVVALQHADERLLVHVLNNMSKRAKETLQEEMELKANASQIEIDGAREEIVKILVDLDESGAISIE